MENIMKTILEFVKTIFNNFSSWIISRENGSTLTLKTKKENPEELIQSIRKKLEESEKEYYHDFLSYSLYRLALESNMSSSEIKKKIFERYGEVLSEPLIKLGDLFSLGKVQVIEKILKDYLSEKGYTYDERLSPGSNFNYYVYNKAKKEAQEIFFNEIYKG